MNKDSTGVEPEVKLMSAEELLKDWDKTDFSSLRFGISEIIRKAQSNARAYGEQEERKRCAKICRDKAEIIEHNCLSELNEEIAGQMCAESDVLKQAATAIENQKGEENATTDTAPDTTKSDSEG